MMVTAGRNERDLITVPLLEFKPQHSAVKI
jgi:hypothetical protein